MNCTTWSEKVYDYCYEILEGEELAEFQQHLASCGQCQQLFAHANKGLQLLDKWQPAAISQLANAQLGHIRRRLLLGGGRYWRLAPWSAVAATLMLGFTVGLVWMISSLPVDSGWQKAAPSVARDQSEQEPLKAPQRPQDNDSLPAVPAPGEAMKQAPAEPVVTPALEAKPTAPPMEIAKKADKEKTSSKGRMPHPRQANDSAVARAEPARRLAREIPKAEASHAAKEMDEQQNVADSLPGKDFSPAPSSWQAEEAEADDKPVAGVTETPEALLQSLMSAWRSKNAQAMAACIYPSSWRVEMVRHMLRDDAHATAPWACSKAALKVLIARSANRFQPINEEFRQQLSKGERFGYDAKVADLANRPTSGLVMFQHRQVSVVMVLTAEGYRLVWWENLNQLNKGS